MRAKPTIELGLIIVLSVLLIIIIVALPSNPLRVVLALPFMLLFPGYALVAALFPSKSDIGGIERIALSMGLSLAIIPLIGLILNYTPWGIALYPILTALVLFIVVVSAIASYRRHVIPADERLTIRLNVNLRAWATLRGWDRALGLVLAVFIVAALGTVAYAATTPRKGETFSQFYVLGLEGMAVGYPEELTLGEEARVILGIVNNEHEDDLEYRVDILINGEKSTTMGPLVLDHGQRWEEETSFFPASTGENQRVDFLLYRRGDADPYESLHLWIDVKTSGQ